MMIKGTVLVQNFLDMKIICIYSSVCLLSGFCGLVASVPPPPFGALV